MIRFTKVQKITIFALIGMGLLNPFTVAVLDDYFKLVYTGVFMVCVVWVCGFILYKTLKTEPVKIPAKIPKSATKSKSGMKYELQ